MNRAKTTRPVVNTLRNPNVGRFTATDPTAGKTIRKDQFGRDVFEDYFTDESMMSTTALPYSVSITPVPKDAKRRTPGKSKSSTTRLARYVLQKNVPDFPNPMSPFEDSTTTTVSPTIRSPLQSISLPSSPQISNRRSVLSQTTLTKSRTILSVTTREMATNCPSTNRRNSRAPPNFFDTENEPSSVVRPIARRASAIADVNHYLPPHSPAPRNSKTPAVSDSPSSGSSIPCAFRALFEPPGCTSTPKLAQAEEISLQEEAHSHKSSEKKDKSFNQKTKLTTLVMHTDVANDLFASIETVRSDGSFLKKLSNKEIVTLSELCSDSEPVTFQRTCQEEPNIKGGSCISSKISEKSFGEALQSATGVDDVEKQSKKDDGTVEDDDCFIVEDEEVTVGKSKACSPLKEDSWVEKRNDISKNRVDQSTVMTPMSKQITNAARSRQITEEVPVTPADEHEITLTEDRQEGEVLELGLENESSLHTLILQTTATPRQSSLSLQPKSLLKQLSFRSDESDLLDEEILTPVKQLVTATSEIHEALPNRENKQKSVSIIEVPTDLCSSLPCDLREKLGTKIVGETSGLESSFLDYVEKPVKKCQGGRRTKPRSNASILKSIKLSQERKNIVSKRIIQAPEEEEGIGQRRSKRKKVPVLDFWKGERVQYKSTDSGDEITGIIEVPSAKPKSRRPKRSNGTKKKRDLTMTSFEDSGHVDNGGGSSDPFSSSETSLSMSTVSTAEVAIGQEIPILNPETQEEVLIVCVAYDDGTTVEKKRGKPVWKTTLKQRAFESGFLTLPPGAETPYENVNYDTWVYAIFDGVVEARIHHSDRVLRKKDYFLVPSGNFYSLKNVGKTAAVLSYSRMLGMDEPEP